MSAAKRKPRGASADTPAQKSAANCGRVTIDRAQFAEIFRRLARKSEQAAALNREIADFANQAADKFATPTPATSPRPARKGAVQNA